MAYLDGDVLQYKQHVSALHHHSAANIAYLHQSSAMVKKVCHYTFIPPIRLHGVMLNEAEGAALPWFFSLIKKLILD